MKRRGFTLVELAVSVAIMGIVVVAMGSAVYVSTRAASDSGDQEAQASASTAADVAEQMAADLRVALSFSERTDKAITFTVPDRNGDGQPETIRYAWSGQNDDPLTREYNGSAPGVLAEEVRGLTFRYVLQTMTPPTPTDTESAEMLLISHEGVPGGSSHAFDIDSNSWAAQYFKPTLPANAVGWRITRIQVAARGNGLLFPGQMELRLTAANVSQLPSLPVLSGVVINESILGNNFAWVEALYGTLQTLDPQQGYCLVVAYKSGSGKVGTVLYQENGTPMPPNTHYTNTGNAGGSYSNPSTSKDLYFRVYGTVTTQ